MTDKAIYIEWLDSQGCTPSWVSLSDYKPYIPTHKSMGWVVFEDEYCISICSNIADETETSLYQGNGIMTIPRVAITRMKIISEKELSF